MKKNFLKFLALALVVGLVVGLVIGMQSVSFASDVLETDEIILDAAFLDKTDDSAKVDEAKLSANSISEVEDVLSSYVGHYEVDRDAFVEELKKVIAGKCLTSEFVDMFSMCALDIYEAGDASTVMVVDADPMEVKVTLNMEFVSVTDKFIIFKLSKDDNSVDVVFEREERDGKQYLVLRENDMTSCFEKLS